LHKLLHRQLKKLGLLEGSNDINQNQFKALLNVVTGVYKKNSELLEKNKNFITVVKLQNDFLKKIISGASIEEVFNSLLQRVVPLLKANAGTIYVYNIEKNQIEAISTYGLSKVANEMKRVPVSGNTGESETAAHLKKPVYIGNINTNEKYKNFDDTGDKTAFVASWSHPIVNIHQELYGVFSVYLACERLPSKQEIEILEIVTHIAIICFEKEKDRTKLENEHLKLISSSKKAVLGEMAGGIAHEINNPLAIIQGVSGKMKILLEHNKLDKDLTLDSIGKIIGTVKRIKDIIDALRLHSRDESTVPTQLNHIEDIFDSALALCAEKMKYSGVNIEKIIHDKNIEVYCNEVQINQVLVNLISNAYDAISGKEHPWIRIEAKKSQHKVIISITDCGEGIHPDIIEKMMLPFFTSKEANNGTGIGLSISESIIKSHHGKFYYNYHSPNTQFVIELPLLVP